ncbi:hypothetical protein E2K80_07325 [Rhodophyticola sp. CCM32]|uniref:hypothetical protein n=1 Tax=Rhodophyticola sp. CCM32 TaxID=2916397 RepID=UPI00107FB8A5|nr:hypothetical protein [Rhodophyticola sp. CCM32]QBY00574.1 hypothetical protein E2K80_07325 [Rhodophyticola sp. CCM32]
MAAVGEEAEWRALYDCAEEHAVDVARVVVSVDEGAGLIVEVLCVDESTAVANAMMSTRSDVVERSGSFGAAFTSFLSVITREMRALIYTTKLEQS